MTVLAGATLRIMDVDRIGAARDAVLEPGTVEHVVARDDVRANDAA
jgi:hypothetical protein